MTISSQLTTKLSSSTQSPDLSAISNRSQSRFTENALVRRPGPTTPQHPRIRTAARVIYGTSHSIQHPVHTIAQVHVPVPCGPEHHLVSSGFTTMSMASLVLRSIVSLGLTNSHAKRFRGLRRSTTKPFAYKLSSHLDCRPIKKRRIQHLAFSHFKKQKANTSCLENRAVWSRDRHPPPRRPYERETVRWGLAFAALRTSSLQNIRKEFPQDREKPPD